ncbi:pyruvate, phosphate dikinase [bacterium]|nr:pyruvate, phosphate dikinase [bacterium]
MSKKYVYFFGEGKAEGNTGMKNLLGGKGADLAEMTNLGIPVPPGFTITTEACIYYYQHKGKYPRGMKEEIDRNLKRLEKTMGAGFGDRYNPLLVSVRSGARVSMPGMMDTILNLGLNDETIKGLIKAMGHERFAWDAYRRLIQMFAHVVMGMESSEFEEIIEEKKKELGIRLDTEFKTPVLKDLVERFKKRVKKRTKKDFPQDPRRQLFMAIDAVFGSWNTQRAITYRNLNNLSHTWGTAANVQTMVFGNMGWDSGTGVAFTRDPATGEKKFFGEYLLNAQGEDVVAGIRTPKKISQLAREMPRVYRELVRIYKKLERHYRDIQDLEFTIQNKKLFLLQTRTGKRTAQAALKIAVDMVKEKLISRKEAILRVEPSQFDQLLHRRIDPKARIKVIAKGLAASPGAAVGEVVFTADHAQEEAEKGRKVVLVRNETSPEDIHGMAAAQGILTSRGGLTSHAAVVARGMGKCCVAGCEAIDVDYDRKRFVVGNIVVREGDYLSLNGNTGEVILGRVHTIEPTLSKEFQVLMKWADETRRLGVRTNADTPKDAKKAREFGAEGIGLTRTEHMFFGEKRLPIVREMILARDERTREKALKKLLPMQREDFRGIFKAMEGLPVTIRLLDPPLHEFLPKVEELLVEITTLKVKKGSKKKIAQKEKLLNKIEALREMNPMLGHRGCRLGVTTPEIYRMQAQAIFEAACELTKEGYKVIPEVMIPLVGHVNELKLTKEDVHRVADEVMKRKKMRINYSVGTMIELPRACITADEIAKEAEFFSFGTNDLTQTVFGFSRDDIEGKFLPAYLEKNVLDNNPFEVLDQKGVGELIEMAVKKGRRARKGLKIGICGEHGGEPESVKFCHRVGLDYVSCSPYRVPIARLAAAHAALKSKKVGK